MLRRPRLLSIILVEKEKKKTILSIHVTNSVLTANIKIYYYFIYSSFKRARLHNEHTFVNNNLTNNETQNWSKRNIIAKIY